MLAPAVSWSPFRFRLSDLRQAKWWLLLADFNFNIRIEFATIKKPMNAYVGPLFYPWSLVTIH